MKIQDILQENQFEVSRTERKFSGSLRSSTREKGSANEINRGTQSIIKADKLDPHMVTKYSKNPYIQDRESLTQKEKRDNRDDDGFNKFINYLIDNNLMGVNPHFPRVYNINTIKDKDGKHIHKFTVEKLIEPFDISLEELIAFANNTFNIDKLSEYDSHLTDVLTYSKDIEEVFFNIVGLIDKILDKKVDNSIVKSDSFMEALNLLKKMEVQFKSEGYTHSMDLHMYNYMWRRTQHGIVLVFNDPFF